MSGAPQHDYAFASASSSSHSPAPANTPPSAADDDHADLDFLAGDDARDGDDDNDDDVLADDPIRQELNTPLSFKRRQKQSFLSAPSRFFSAFASGSGSADSPGFGASSQRYQHPNVPPLVKC